jgi:predicted O-methyltransferase YrrM
MTTGMTNTADAGVWTGPATPYAFADAYAGCYAVPAMAMDRRHVYLIHDVLRQWPFRNTLELGSWMGASSTAFVEAINAGAGMVATFCDVSPTDSLWDVVGNCRHPERVRVTADKSWEVLESPEDFDLVLVDANHDLASVRAELDRLVVRKPICIIAHDTAATANGYPHAEGAAMLTEELRTTWRNRWDYQAFTDDRKRDGEETHRGLTIATREPGLARIVRRAFDHWDRWQPKHTEQA